MTQNATSKKTKGQLKREAVIARARDTLITLGYDAFVLREIANQLDMTLGNLQYYFPTRESLLEAVIRSEALTDLDDLRSALNTEQTAAQQLSNFVKFIVKKWRGESGVILSTMSFLSLHQSSFQGMYQDIYTNFYDELAVVLKQIDPGRKAKVYHRRARLITALVDGAAVQIQHGSAVDFLADISDLALSIAMPTS